MTAIVNVELPAGKLEKIGSVPVMAVQEITELTCINERKLGDYTESIVTLVSEKYEVSESTVISVSSTVESLLFPDKHDGKGIFEKYVKCIWDKAGEINQALEDQENNKV